MELVLTITMSQDSSIRVDGPIRNKVICYGMLEAAKELIHQENEKQTRLVQPITTMALLVNERS